MGVSCQIFIRTPSEGVHKAGTPVTGVVKYAVDKPTKYKDIVIGLVGKGVCKWSERQGKQTIQYIGTDVYTSQYISIYDQKSEPDYVLPVGCYEYPFSLLLPPNIPPSFEDSTCKIRYKVVLKFEKPQFFSTHKKFKTEISVYGFATPIIPDQRTTFGLEKTLFKPFSKKDHKVNLKAEIDNTIYSPGQNAELVYMVSNDTNIVIPSVKTELICKTTYTANCGSQLKKIRTIQECTVDTPSVPENAVANMSNKVPILSHLYSIQYSRIIAKEFKIKVTVRLPIPYINSSTDIPIAIGEIYRQHQNNIEMEEIGVEPPSYWEAMNEDKDK